MEVLETMNVFCNQFPPWRISYSGGNSYLLSCNFITQDRMIGFNPENGLDVSLNPTALFPFFDNEIQGIVLDGSVMTITTITGIYTCDGNVGSISRTNLQ